MRVTLPFQGGAVVLVGWRTQGVGPADLNPGLWMVKRRRWRLQGRRWTLWSGNHEWITVSGRGRFFHADHLGSPKVKTAVNGTESERWDHYPYGETWVPGAPGDQHRYTGHLRDAESENDYAGARYYAHQRGRWLSVDPVLGDLSNPQRLNRYAYVINNPINFIDPDGAQPAHFLAVSTHFTEPGWGWYEEAFTRSGPGPGGGAGAGEGGAGGSSSSSGLQEALVDKVFSNKANSARNELKQRIRWDKPDCADIFSTLGVTKDAYLSKLNEVIFLDGTTSSLLIEDLMNEPWARLKGVLGWTVAELFERGFPNEDGTHALVNAFSPPTGASIFLYGQRIPGSPLPAFSGVNAATIAHEVFHKFRKYDDDLLLKKWGLDSDKDSSDKFTDYFRRKCL